MRDFNLQKDYMINNVFNRLDIKDPKVMSALRYVDRHLFLPEALWYRAYEDIPLPIGYNQTISSPSIVAYMSHLLNLSGMERILEIGTGSGYQAAVLSRLASQVYTVEVKDQLYEKATNLLKYKLKIINIKCYLSDGNLGLEQEAPFDRIIVTCSAYDGIPNTLISQLDAGGRMIIPVAQSDGKQNLVVLDKSTDGRTKIQVLGEVDFVPFIKGNNNDVSISMA